MKKPARPETKNVERQGDPANAEYVARYMIEINEYASHATANETQAPKRKCASSQRTAKKTRSGVISTFFDLFRGSRALPC